MGPDRDRRAGSAGTGECRALSSDQASIAAVTSPDATPMVVGLRCDADAASGVGHVVRSVALADELRRRGHSAVLLGTVAVDWVRGLLAERGIEIAPAPDSPDGLADLAGELGLGAVVLDGYRLDPGCGAAIRARGIRVLSIVDGDWGGGQAADVYLDQNLGARPPAASIPGAVQLAGIDYVLFRDDVLARRPAPGEVRPHPERPRLLALFGGTDPHGAAPVVVGLALATGVPVEIVAVAAREELAVALSELPTGPEQTVTVLPSAPSLAAVAASCDAAVSAAGSSTWELLCLGVPTALVAVVDNQEIGYVATVERGVADPAGRLGALRNEESARADSTTVLRRLLTDPRHRAELRRRGMELVDGRGRERVADALLGP